MTAHPGDVTDVPAGQVDHVRPEIAEDPVALARVELPRVGGVERATVLMQEPSVVAPPDVAALNEMVDVVERWNPTPGEPDQGD